MTCDDGGVCRIQAGLGGQAVGTTRKTDEFLSSCISDVALRVCRRQVRPRSGRRGNSSSLGNGGAARTWRQAEMPPAGGVVVRARVIGAPGGPARKGVVDSEPSTSSQFLFRSWAPGMPRPVNSHFPNSRLGRLSAMGGPSPSTRTLAERRCRSQRSPPAALHAALAECVRGSRPRFVIANQDIGNLATAESTLPTRRRETK